MKKVSRPLFGFLFVLGLLLGMAPYVLGFADSQAPTDHTYQPLQFLPTTPSNFGSQGGSCG